jgi:hypothetical protein
MDAADAGKTHKSLRHALGGLEAGVTGALLMIVWTMAASLLSRRSIWTIPNLYATTFYGARAYENQFLRSSWSGMALIVAICGFGGMLWGVIVKDQSRPFLALFGAFAGLAVYFLFFAVIWLHANPLIPLYAPARQTQIGFVLWGLALARSPRFSRGVAI